MPAPVSGSSDGDWLAGVVRRVNAHLERFFEEKREQARATSPEAQLLVDAVATLTMRGGKRLRPAALHAAYCAVGGGDASRTEDVASALELLQSYLLIQDDWMDGDAERRGGPSVHAALSAAHGSRLGESLAILAADVASGFAWELVARAPFPNARLREALATFGRTHFEVVCGQQLDLTGHTDVGLVHQLKTGSYTVRGPLALGALLADASAAQLQALERFGAPLGLAFQLRDDLLSCFGDPGALGKPVGNDLRAGKHSALLSEARALFSGPDRVRFDEVFGRRGASDVEVARVTEALFASGVRERLQQRLDALLVESSGALDMASFTPEGAAMLRDLAQRMATRDR
jgi:geranylgeranyl diphosphate synthase type I